MTTIQLANPTVVEKIEQLARLTQQNKTSVVKAALDSYERSLPIGVQSNNANETINKQLLALLTQLDALPNCNNSNDETPNLTWDNDGLPQ